MRDGGAKLTLTKSERECGRAAHCNKGSLFCVYFVFVYVRSKQIDNFDIKNAIEKCINVISAREFFLSAFFFFVFSGKTKERKVEMKMKCNDSTCMFCLATKGRGLGDHGKMFSPFEH